MPIQRDTLGKGQVGTPLHLVDNKNFEGWLASQNDFIKNWIRHSKFETGLLLIPNEKGELSLGVFKTDSFDSLWATATLASQLPQQDFHIVLATGLETSEINIGLAWLLGGYEFTRYKESKSKTAKLHLSDSTDVEEIIKIADGVGLVRDLVNTPAGDMMPQNLFEEADALAKEFNGKCSAVFGDDLLKHNFPTIHAVGRASVHKPALIDLTWGDPTKPMVTLVGKGVCFDSGGLDLKPAAGMRLMKKDMGGAAHVLGLAKMIMALELPIRLRVLVPAVENAVSSNAFRPGDVIKTRKGLTVEIDNTDAEGRLVLCDALALAEEESPEVIIDFATLTGACRVALGTSLPGYFTDEEDIALGLMESGNAIQDPVWRLPLFKQYRDQLKSEVADISNCGPTPFGGAITAGLYLQEFVEKTPWVHFDVMAWNNAKLSGRPVGGEAFGVRSVLQWLKSKYC